MKQPRVPEHNKGESTGRYILKLILFLKDFTMAVWEKLDSHDKEIEDLKNLVSKGSEIDG